MTRWQGCIVFVLSNIKLVLTLPQDNSQILLILVVYAAWLIYHIIFVCKGFTLLFCPFYFLRKGHNATSIVLRTVNHCWKAKACVVGHYTENCLTGHLHLRAPSRNYLLVTASDWSIRQCYSSAPTLTSMISDLHYVFEELTNQQSRSVLFLAMGKSLFQWLKTASNALAQHKLIQFTSCCCRSRKALVVVPKDEQI